MNFGSKRNISPKKNKKNQMPDHVGLVEKMRIRKKRTEDAIKKMRGQ